MMLAGLGTCSNDFHAGDDIKAMGACGGKLFCWYVLIVDRIAAFQQVQAGDAEGFFREVDSGDVGATLGHAFCEDAATAANIENRLSRKFGVAINPFEP